MTDDQLGRTSPRARGEGGYTIIEVIVAMVMLVVGVLGMLVMVEGSLSSTSRTTAREQATNLAREVVERSREVPYASTNKTAVAAALAAVLPETPAATGSTFVVRRRNVDYTVTVTGCSIDDPADGAGVGDTTYCAASTSNPGNPAVGSGFAAGLNVLGIVPVSLVVGGSLMQTACNIIGTDTAIGNSISGTATSLLGLVGNGAQVVTCAGATGGSIAYDSAPDDLRRVRVKVAWNQSAQPYSLTQTTLVTSPST